MTQYEVGQLHVKDGESWLITRIVDSKAFFEDRDTKECYEMDELYLELRNAAGDINFVTLREHKSPKEKAPEVIEAGLIGPDTLEWRKLGKVE